MTLVKASIIDNGDIVQVDFFLDYEPLCSFDGEDLGDWVSNLNNLTKVFKLNYDSYIELEFTDEEYELWKEKRIN